MRGFGLIVALLFTVTEVSAVSELEADADACVVRRPLVEERCFRSTAVDSVIAVMQDRLSEVNPKLWTMFCNCYPNTLDTAVKRFRACSDVTGRVEDFTFVITGDIDAMWLRDSAAQVWTYLSLLDVDEDLRLMVRGVIRMQLEFVCRDAYANAFLRSVSDSTQWRSDFTLMLPGVHERKYEIDSLCYPIRLAYAYWQITGDDSIFDELWVRAVGEILRVFSEQQRRDGVQRTSYRFGRTTHAQHDTTSNYGLGHPVKPCGLIASMFRPSDDSCVFPFNIPGNFFAVSALRKAAEILTEVSHDEALAGRCRGMADEVYDALMRYSIVQSREFGPVFAYEIDGFGSHLLMDDANVPSLLSLPYLCGEIVDERDSVYQNTRRMVWSEYNPYFFGGGLQGLESGVRGIGSQHTGLNMVWPMSIIMRGLTTKDVHEQRECISVLMQTDGGTGFMHESFLPSDPTRFTRSWFSWVNGLFGELVLRAYGD